MFSPGLSVQEKLPAKQMQGGGAGSGEYADVPQRTGAVRGVQQWDSLCGDRNLDTCRALERSLWPPCPKDGAVIRFGALRFLATPALLLQAGSRFFSAPHWHPRWDPPRRFTALILLSANLSRPAASLIHKPA